MSAAEIQGPRDSFRIPALHMLDFAAEHWMPLSLAGLSRDALNRIAEQTTEVLFVTLLSGPHKGVQLVGMRSLARFIARRGTAQYPGRTVDISHVLAGLKDTQFPAKFRDKLRAEGRAVSTCNGIVKKILGCAVNPVAPVDVPNDKAEARKGWARTIQPTSGYGDYANESDGQMKSEIENCGPL